MRRGTAFTLVELLVVIAIITVLGAILYPVFYQARGTSYRASCQSNQMQLGVAVMQYAQDYDERVPSGLNWSKSMRIWAGEGWAGQCSIYVKSAGLFTCPADITPVHGVETASSYGYNYNLIQTDGLSPNEDPRGRSLSEVTSPTKSVLIFEVSGVTTVLPDSHEGAYSGRPGSFYSASGNGLDNRLYAHKDWSTGIDNQYATGYLGGRQPFNMSATQFASAEGRHNGGSNFLLCDGHVKWMRGAAVSSGLNALQENCSQDNSSNRPGCGGAFYSEASSNNGPFQASFSTR